MRQREGALLVAQAYANKVFANRIGINLSAVETNRLRAFDKLALAGAANLANHVGD